MSKILIGSARIDENGNVAGGTAGDQKQATAPDHKGEVSICDFYVHNKGWYIFRPVSIYLADRLADLMTRACNNSNIGYDQNNRAAIYNDSVGSNVPTECDCSSLVCECLREATGIYVSDFTTLSEPRVLSNTGLFYQAAYKDGVKLYAGDILVTKTKGHTAIVVKGEARNGDYFPAYTGRSFSIVDALSAVGEIDTSFSHRKAISEANGIVRYEGTAKQNLYMLNLLKNGELKRA